LDERAATVYKERIQSSLFSHAKSVRVFRTYHPPIHLRHFPIFDSEKPWISGRHSQTALKVALWSGRVLSVASILELLVKKISRQSCLGVASDVVVHRKMDVADVVGNWKVLRQIGSVSLGRLGAGAVLQRIAAYLAYS
jgi:hypothetical protein